LCVATRCSFENEQRLLGEISGDSRRFWRAIKRKLAAVSTESGVNFLVLRPQAVYL